MQDWSVRRATILRQELEADDYLTRKDLHERIEATVDCRYLSTWWINWLMKERKGMVRYTAFSVTAMAIPAPTAIGKGGNHL
jgi:hypothetical protein